MSSAQFDTIKDRGLRPALRPDQSIRLFPLDGPWAPLEELTYAAWWEPFCTWLLVSWILFWYCTAPGLLKYALIAFSWLVGWPLVEYGLHRFVFHAPVAWASRWGLPQWMQGCVNVGRLLAHTVHHAHPTDRRRIVTPFAMSAPIAIGVLAPFFLLLPEHLASSIVIGLILGYVQYDWTHYYLHCGTPPAQLPDWAPWKAWFQRLHKSHANHHYATFGPEQSFSVAHELPDKLFGTAHNSEGVK